MSFVPKIVTLIFFWMVAVGIAVYIWSLGDTEALRNTRPNFTFGETIQHGLIITLGILLASILFYLFLIRKEVSSLRSPFPIKLALVTLIFVALILRFLQPLEHHFFGDEMEYLNMSKMISLTGRANICSFVTFDEGHMNCVRNFADFFTLRKGYPLLLAGVLGVFGDRSDLPAFLFNILLGVLTVPLVYFFVKEFASRRAAFLAATFVAVLPEHIRWSANTSSDVPALFFLLSSLFFFQLFVKRRNFSLFILSLFILSYASFMRTEMILALPFLLIALLFDINLRPLVIQKA